MPDHFSYLTAKGRLPTITQNGHAFVANGLLARRPALGLARLGRAGVAPPTSMNRTRKSCFFFIEPI